MMNRTTKKSTTTKAVSRKTDATATKPPVQTVKARATTAQPAASKISFQLVLPQARQVCVAGSFNQWKPESSPLLHQGNGRWIADVTVEPGRYEYLFVVDGQWIPDPQAKESVSNPFGGQNSVLVVSA